MTALSPYLRDERENPDIEKGSPHRQNPDILPDDDSNTPGPIENIQYGWLSSFETKGKDYRSNGLPKTNKYTVDKEVLDEPEVSTPKKEKEQSDRDDRPDYGF